ncbi:MAG: BatD family protein [Desulforhopalus sp.]
MRHRLLFIHLLSGLVMTFFFLAAASAEVTVEASLSHLSFPVDQAAQLTITVNGSQDIKAVQLPEIDNIRTQYRGQSSRINMINGSFSSSVSHNYLIQALQPGQYTLPPVTVKAGGESLTTAPLHFTVTGTGQKNGAASVAPQQSKDEPVLIRVSDTGEHYSGEIVPITIKAYFKQQYRADSISLPTLEGDGVVMEQLQDKPRQSQEQMDGKLYSVLTWDTAISGVKVGKHPIHFSLDATLLIPQKRRTRSPFGGGSMFGDSMFDDPFFDSFFGGYQRKVVSVSSPQRTFTVLPLPTDTMPDNFTGAIGDFDLKVTVSPTHVEVGEPMTLTMAISGEGNFDRVEAPVFPENPDWKTYSPTVTSHGEKGEQSSKIFEQALVAKNDAATAIPPLSFSYFDPVKKTYITRVSQPISIDVKESARQPAPQAQQQTVPQQQRPPSPPNSLLGLEGLAPIHLKTGSFHSDIKPLFMKSWFILLCVLCVLILVVLFAIKWRKVHYARNPGILTERNRRLQLKIDLKKIEQVQSTSDGAAFLSLARTAIQNQLGALWNTSPTAISLADIQARLEPDSPLIGIFRAADEAAYSGAPLSAEKMQTYYEQMKKELEKLL